MSIGIFHTADVHIGMKFTRGYPEGVQDSLIEARFAVVRNMVDSANKRGCDLFVIAGDLFDRQTVAHRDIVRTTEILKRFAGKLVLVLPGNHDFISRGETCLWNDFKKNMGEQTIVLENTRPYDLRRYNVEAVVYPAPCTSKHCSENAVGWIAAEEKSAGVLHVGVAHGSYEGVSPDFNMDYFPMSPRDLAGTGIDIWLMGHTHARVPDEDEGSTARVFFPATPEPDGFDCRHEGRAWVIEIGDDGLVKYESVKTGQFRFRCIEEQLNGDHQLEKLERRLGSMNKDCDLVKLKIAGRVPGEVYERRSALIKELTKRVLHLEADVSGMIRDVTAADIDAEFTKDSFPHKLLSGLAAGHGNPRALQMAYELIQEARR